MLKKVLNKMAVLNRMGNKTISLYSKKEVYVVNKKIYKNMIHYCIHFSVYLFYHRNKDHINSAQFYIMIFALNSFYVMSHV